MLQTHLLKGRGMIRKALLSWLMTVLLFLGAPAQATHGNGPIYLYANEFLLPGLQMSSSQRTVEAITNAVHPCKVIIKTVSIEELDRAVAAGQAHIAIVGAAIYRRHVRSGMRDIATLVTPKQPDPDHAVGALVVTRSSENAIRTIEDLKGRKIGVNHPVGFQGLLVLLKDIADMGYDHERFFSDIRYYGLEPTRRLNALRRGEVDAITLNVCYAERALDKGHNVLEGLKPVGLRDQTQVNCQASTSLYPNWTVLVSHTLDAPAIVNIASALHKMPLASDGHQWTIASDFHNTDNLYRTLKAGPYAYLNDWTLDRLWQEYEVLFVSILLALCLWGFHTIRVSQLVKKRTEALNRALAEQKELSRTTDEMTQKYEKMRRAFTVTQLSGLIAHELSQPLSGILLYVRGLKSMLNNGGLPSSPTVIETLGKIDERARKAERIVDRVRRYAKSDGHTIEFFDLLTLIRQTVSNFVRAGKIHSNQIKLDTDLDALRVCVSQLEMELVLNNLIKNSIESTATCPRPSIRMSARLLDGTRFEFTITDNAPPIEDEVLEKIRQPLNSFKPEGLGLGLSIVQSIVEQHMGYVYFEKTLDHHLLVRIVMPVGEQPNSEESSHV